MPYTLALERRGEPLGRRTWPRGQKENATLAVALVWWGEGDSNPYAKFMAAPWQGTASAYSATPVQLRSSVVWHEDVKHLFVCPGVAQGVHLAAQAEPVVDGVGRQFEQRARSTQGIKRVRQRAIEPTLVL